MSHKTKFDTRIKFKTRAFLELTLNHIQKELGSTFTFTYDPAKDQFAIRYAPIEVYQKNGNLSFIREGDHYVAHCDFYKVSSQLTDLINRVQVGYQAKTIHAFYSMNRYSTTANQQGKDMVIMARGF